jgi:hypothetical protein
VDLVASAPLSNGVLIFVGISKGSKSSLKVGFAFLKTAEYSEPPIMESYFPVSIGRFGPFRCKKHLQSKSEQFL